MNACVRPYDTVGRYGGEEFLIIVSAGDVRATASVAERVRAAIAAKPVATDAGVVTITASLGIAVSMHDEPLETQEMLRSADEALYQAKARGRNRVELFDRNAIPLNAQRR